MNDEPRFSRLLLASGSAARRELLARFGLSFDVIPADIDEEPRPGESPPALAERLSREKARVVAQRHPESLVIGSDQVAVYDGKPTGKPGSEKRAREALRRFSGSEVTFLTGVCLHHADSGHEAFHLDTTVVRFRLLQDDEIVRYVSKDDPGGCAGGFKVEALGPALFDWVRSEDPTALPGLPLIRLAAMLRECGFKVP